MLLATLVSTTAVLVVTVVMAGPAPQFWRDPKNPLHAMSDGTDKPNCVGYRKHGCLEQGDCCGGGDVFGRPCCCTGAAAKLKISNHAQGVCDWTCCSFKDLNPEFCAEKHDVHCKE